jgi:hypothetical protein
MNTRSFQGILWEDVFLEVLVTRVSLRSGTASRYATPPTISTTDMGKTCDLPCSNICHNRKFKREVCQYRFAVCLTVTC